MIDCYVPGPICDQLVRRAYVAGYDRRLRHPAWVGSISFPSLFLLSLTRFSLSPQTAEHLTLASLGKSPNEEPAPGGDREKSTFQEDESLPAVFRAKLQDYFRSGYDRGHMCVCFHYITTHSSMIRVASLSLVDYGAFVIAARRVPAADAKRSQVKCPWHVLLQLRAVSDSLANRKTWMRHSYFLISPLKLVSVSIAIVRVCPPFSSSSRHSYAMLINSLLPRCRLGLP